MAKRGSALIELIVVIGLTAAFLFSVSGVAAAAIKLTRQAARRAQAAEYLREGVAAVRFLRDSGWGANIAPLAPGTAYYLAFDSAAGRYEATTTEPAMLDGVIQRQISAAEVRRDGADNIADSGAVDPGARLVTVQAAWRDGTATSTESLRFYLMDVWRN